MIINLQNPKVKNVVRLQQKSSERKKTGTFVIEGKREISIAIQSGFNIFEVYQCHDIYEPDQSYPIDTNTTKVIPVSKDVYNKMAYRKDSEGIIGLAYSKDTKLTNIKLSSNPLLLVLENVEKPGNLGAVLRTGDASGVDAVIVCDSKTDIYNPNVIRSSLGCVFSNQVIICNSSDFIRWSKKNEFSIYTAMPETDTLYHEVNYIKPTALVFGAESEGLSKHWLEPSFTKIKIPMSGKIDSLNVSVSAAIVVFEALRQRNALTTS